MQSLPNAPVRMAIHPRWRPVRRPSRVRNPGVRVEDLRKVGRGFGDELFQFRDFTDFFEGEDLVPFVAVDGEAGGVIAAVFEAGEA